MALTDNTTALEALRDQANALPDAGSGGGTVETCTVIISNVSDYGVTGGNISFTTYNNGTFSTVAPAISVTQTPYTIENVVVNSSVMLGIALGAIVHDASSAHTLEEVASGDYTSVYKVVGDCSFGFYVCLARDTKITLANGGVKPVQDITMDDLLTVWDFDNGCTSTAKPLWIKKVQTACYYYLCEFEDGTTLKLVGSGGKCHRVFSVDKNVFLSATDCVGHMVMTRNGAVRIVSCERVDESVEFYNIITENHMNLYAEGVLTSTRLNNLYPIRDMRFVKDVRTVMPIEAFPAVPSEYYYGLRLGERKAEDIDWLLPYVHRLLSLMVDK